MHDLLILTDNGTYKLDQQVKQGGKRFANKWKLHIRPEESIKSSILGGGWHQIPSIKILYQTIYCCLTLNEKFQSVQLICIWVHSWIFSAQIKRCLPIILFWKWFNKDFLKMSKIK
jgi:hypothetical protein